MAVAAELALRGVWAPLVAVPARVTTHPHATGWQGGAAVSGRVARAGEALWRRMVNPEAERRKLIAEHRDAVREEAFREAAERIRAASWPAHAEDGAAYAADLIDPGGQR